MRPVIVGSGTVEFVLTDTASKAGRDVVVIAPDPERAAQCADQAVGPVREGVPPSGFHVG